ncbi:uncharacterized protein BJ212DRAFT_1449691 [Suillus subaureus]|uniref:Uncharacterized protein n=1 Tax=Suillus subaureus TaxID=48587 RepID=A0A9P7DVV0_9AGAM|nr:uncharacterized protein BJ212DRAFT_1449691 [Suillus subaureus]KAG1804646.1 hypothetical protein BJ212DRAFT_1449691 [Suillus subaureus]
MKQDNFKDMWEHNVYYLFSDRAEWELAKFLCKNLNQGQITRFLKLLWNAKQLFTFMEALPVTPKWKCTPIETDGYMTTHPMNLICQLPTGTSIVPIILASDKTPVTQHTGSLEMHPTFLTIGNIHSEIHMKATSHTWACITYIPTPEYIMNHDFSGVLEVHLWHRCMDMVLQNLKVAAQVGKFMTDPMGCQHYAFTLLATHISDLPEQLMIAYPWKVREFLEQAKQQSLSGVHLPYWRDWWFSDPAIFLIPELLHTCHKFFFNHILKWCKEVVGVNELDAQFHSQHKHVGMRHFADGISHVNQMTGYFIYKSQAPTFTNSSIGSMVASLNEFHAHKHFILEVEACTGASGPMSHFQIPKLKLFNSFAHSICKSADASERLLITHCKTPFTWTSHQRSMFTQQVDTMQQFDLYALLREWGISLFNEVVDTDPTFSWIVCITPQEMHWILSNEASVAFHITIAHNLTDKNATTLANHYHLPHFPQLLAQFLEVVSGPNLHFHGHLLKACNIMPSQQVQAYPPSDSHPYGNCNIVLLQPPGHDPQYFCCLFHTAPDGSRTWVGKIGCLIDVTHAIELIPVYGVTLDCTVTSAKSLECYNDFYLNAFSDKEWYHTLHADYV